MLCIDRMSIHSPTIAALAVSALLLSQAATPAAQRPEPPAVHGPLTIEAIQVAPAGPASSPLRRLSVTIANRGEDAVSRIAFIVKINGRPIDAYAHTRFLNVVAPGQADLRLYNFWVAEPGRTPAAPSEVEVTIAAADRVAHEEGPDRVSTWTSRGAVSGLPASKRIVVPVQGER